MSAGTVEGPLYQMVLIMRLLYIEYKRIHRFFAGIGKYEVRHNTPGVPSRAYRG